jgi:predicted nucleic acid-binding protein
VPGELLLDTGAMVSLLDRSQRRHREFVGFFQTWKREVVTTEAVVREATHLLAGGVRRLQKFVAQLASA